MPDRHNFAPRTIMTRLKYPLIGLFALLIAFALVSHFNITGKFGGLFLLKGKDGALFEVKDDLYLGDGRRLILGLDLDSPRYRIFRFFNRQKPHESYLYSEWDEKTGSGFVRNFLPDGRQILTCFGRYQEDEKQEVHGLFVGGGLPSSVRDDDKVKMDETGMAYYNGKRWYHIWCNVNEGISSGITFEKHSPSAWKYIGSKVLDKGSKALTIKSSHEVVVDGIPIRIDRYAHFRAGDAYFLLGIVITNKGKANAVYYYCYGDEPWLGDFGTSAGNVGWVGDGLINYEQPIDTGKYDYAGMYDCGNSVLGKGSNYTGVANFIQWMGPDRPEFAYFSNTPGSIHTDSKIKVPLSSNERFIGLQWGPHALMPGGSESITLAIGMASRDPKTGFPVKPVIRLKDAP